MVTSGKRSRFLLTFTVLYVLYIALTSSTRLSELIVGFISAALIGAGTYGLMIHGGVRDKFDFRKWYWAITYFFYYWFCAEVTAHYDVIKRILNPKMPLNPGIVKVPYTMKTDCGITAAGNSIINTPGTIVVELNESKNCYYVHWIDVASPEPKVCYDKIVADFEYYVGRIFG